ncbi:SAM-dependent methyltransferase [Elstera litoralis]|uniref:SAM-dependent methyltransferase n=1 Tax=Elstera litoralis TaxID=552518 RepID=UPI0038BD90C2
MPATTRDTNQALIFATGHLAAEADGGLDWATLGSVDAPIVLYMGLTNLAPIAAKLIAAGRAPTTPVAIVTNATLPEQATLESTLENIVAASAAAAVAAPAIIVIGNIVSLRADLLPWQQR